ncbi:MAG: hypothetical protein AB7S77_19740 [Desulfatirhabdiaceae bacterium]
MIFFYHIGIILFFSDMWGKGKADGDFDQPNCGGGNPGYFLQTGTEIIDMAFQIKIWVRYRSGMAEKGLLPYQNHYLKSYR